jgi:hypothetical protein
VLTPIAERSVGPVPTIDKKHRVTFLANIAANPAINSVQFIFITCVQLDVSPGQAGQFGCPQPVKSAFDMALGIQFFSTFQYVR